MNDNQEFKYNVEITLAGPGDKVISGPLTFSVEATQLDAHQMFEGLMRGFGPYIRAGKNDIRLRYSMVDKP